jgi:hypothetical protein
MWTKEERILFYFATTLRRATTLIQMTVQKIGSNPSLSEVTTMLDARSGQREAYNDMEDEIDEFINFDTEFVECPRFYTELISLARTTDNSVDEALSMSMEYLSNVSNVDDIFQDSLMTCLELSLQIANLTGTTRDLSGNEARGLLNMKKCLAGTLTRMEGHWEHLLQEAQNREETVVFSELESLVQMARFATEKPPPYRETS